LAEINGVPIAKHRGKSIREVVPDLADELEPILREVIASGDPSPRVEIAGETPAEPGDPRVFGAVYLPVTVDDEVVGLTAVVDDITEQKRQVDELEQRYRHERDIAIRLQEGLTPQRLPQPADYDIAASYLAGSRGLRIGGDWYDLIELKPDLYAFVVGDVVGHGMDAALAMVQIRHALAGLCHAVARPIEVLEKLDQYATENEDRYVATLVYGLLEPSTGRLTFSSAGHPPPVIIGASGDARQSTHGRGTPLGVTEGTRGAAEEWLEAGDALLLYTDGVFEERGVSVDTSLDRLVETVNRPFRSAGDIVDAVVGAVPSQEHIDDIALLVIRRSA
jgi:serine phosphatase RsbU (regulator of sigma subunit)